MSGLEQIVKSASAVDGVRPVESWNPPYCGDIGLRIRRDGTWLYQNSPIGRIALVKLFASILRKDEDGQTYLVTPVEKIDVAVDDAPFLAVTMDISGAGAEQRLSVRTNVDDVVGVDAAHPIRFEVENLSGGLKPYIRVRGRLDALATRAVYAELAELMVQDADGTFGVWSAGIWFPAPAGPSG